jgi:NDP-sugar pyrophosphorylase family protein
MGMGERNEGRISIPLKSGSTVTVQTEEAALKNILQSPDPRGTALNHLAYVFETEMIDGLEADAQASMSPDELKTYYEEEAKFNRWTTRAIDLTVA